MRHTKNGFTLIELLAVIVILAIIAIIAVPMVLNTIANARKGSVISSAYAYISVAEEKIATYTLKNAGARYQVGLHNISDLKKDLGVGVKGDTPTEGTVCVGSNGTITQASLKINNYVINYDGREAIVSDSTKLEEIACDGGSDTIQAYKTGTTSEVDVIYFNPETNSSCSAEEADANVNSISGSPTETRTGCMKWYVIEDSDEKQNTVNVILNHNTTAGVKWNSEGTLEMKEVADALQRDISTWDSSVAATARMITAEEIVKIVKNTTFDVATSTHTEWFYLDSHNQTQTAIGEGTSQYSWLYDYLYQSSNNGAAYSDNNGYFSYDDSNRRDTVGGYWTSSPIAGHSNLLWEMGRTGQLLYSNVASSAVGIRPVITIDKTNL